MGEHSIMYPIIKQNNKVKVTEFLLTVPDGVGIYTRISVPNGKAKCPIVFDRTPYAEALGGKPYDIERLNDNLFIKHGYAIVTQHCRGSGDSEGEMRPYENERADGLATLDYIRTLPFYDGEIYVIGKSYLASTHLLYLSEKPKDIRGHALKYRPTECITDATETAVARIWTPVLSGLPSALKEDFQIRSL